jgi:hypothetical protein
VYGTRLVVRCNMIDLDDGVGNVDSSLQWGAARVCTRYKSAGAELAGSRRILTGAGCAGQASGPIVVRRVTLRKKVTNDDSMIADDVVEFSFEPRCPYNRCTNALTYRK